MTQQTVICTFRVRAEAEGEFVELLRRHWRTLRELAKTDGRLRPGTLDELTSRAREQASLLEELRVQAAAQLVGAQPAGS